ncbi:unnamed protein product [Bursaphelenchus okinawaensis]|uniref:Uncharacterized protein n=1 Tax=Bursaphelenchus okinawaensis TaxID=465554 RepID=A0A811K5D6_9BILA|nr:unnamed protein product [Bursaphelenchus okinawaensis]CAG9092864.1 unnamed protein product [Bursaphelenchus okinawaensis]
MTCNCVENPHHRHHALHNRHGTLRCASNPPADSKNRPKRDFRFQVIELREGPKWFIWPSNKSQDGENNVICNNDRRSRTKADNERITKNPRCDAISRFVEIHSEPTSSRMRIESEQLHSNSSSSGYSNDSSLSVASDTFQILSVSSKWDSQTEDEDAEDTENANCYTELQDSAVSTPLATKNVVEYNNN